MSKKKHSIYDKFIIIVDAINIIKRNGSIYNDMIHYKHSTDCEVVFNDKNRMKILKFDVKTDKGYVVIHCRVNLSAGFFQFVYNDSGLTDDYIIRDIFYRIIDTKYSPGTQVCKRIKVNSCNTENVYGYFKDSFHIIGINTHNKDVIEKQRKQLVNDVRLTRCMRKSDESGILDLAKKSKDKETLSYKTIDKSIIRDYNKCPLKCIGIKYKFKDKEYIDTFNNITIWKKEYYRENVIKDAPILIFESIVIPSATGLTGVIMYVTVFRNRISGEVKVCCSIGNDLNHEYELISLLFEMDTDNIVVYKDEFDKWFNLETKLFVKLPYINEFNNRNITSKEIKSDEKSTSIEVLKEEVKKGFVHRHSSNIYLSGFECGMRYLIEEITNKFNDDNSFIKVNKEFLEYLGSEAKKCYLNDHYKLKNNQ